MVGIRARCEVWEKTTYAEAFESLSIHDKKLKLFVEDVLNELQIANIPMNGYSCEKLPKTDESRVGIRTTYTEFFHRCLEREDFSPATYLFDIISECFSLDVGLSKTVGATARGLRTLTSLLREPDFAEQLTVALFAWDPNVSTNLNPKQDSSDHTDVLLCYKTKIYRIWLYQFSSRGLPHDIERISGKRGTLPNGIHLLCPLHTEVAMEYDSHNQKLKKNHEKLSLQRYNLTTCSERAIKKKLSIQEQIEKLEAEQNRLLSIVNAEKRIADEELDIVCGWFFYSKAHITRIADYINNISQPVDYNQVVNLLTGPERFVGSINAFIKEE